MNMIRKVVGLMFVAIGSAALFAACNGLDVADCESDIDCLSSEACVNQQCLELCESDEDCFDDEECVDRPDGVEGKVCMGDDDPGQDCVFDDDCAEGEVCYGGDVCVATCDGDGDCVAGEEFCAERDDSASDQQICYALAGPGDACETHEDCQSHLICDDEDNVCVDPDSQVFYHTVLIADVTAFEADPDADRCADTTHGHDTAGAKVMAVILRNAETGAIEAYGDTVGFNRGTGSDFGDPFNVIDGFAPDYENECPDFEEVTHQGTGNSFQSNFYADAVVAIGCDGELYVQFPVDADGGDFNPIVLDESYEIEVREFGPFCSADFEDMHGFDNQSSDDYYDVFLCRDGTDSVSSDDSCDVLVVEAGSGIASYPIEF